MLVLYKAATGLIAIAIGAGGLAGSSGPEVSSPQLAAAIQPAAATQPASAITTTAITTLPLTTARLTTAAARPTKKKTTRARPAKKKTTRPRSTKPAPKLAVGAPCNVTARACIDLSANQSWLLDHGRVVYGPVPITSGRPGWRTPTGTFRVQFKDIDHRSRLFNNAPMPYSVFFNGGIAFHAGSLSVPSHGCIHLSTAAAKTYYGTLRVGDIVQVVP